VKKEKTKAEAVTRQVKTTKGTVDGLGRVAWYYMKKHHGLKEVEIAQLKEATCPAKVNDRAANLIRIFDPAVAKEKGATVEDYESLNQQPELIIYEGYHIPGRGGETIIEKREGVGTSLLDKKMKEGAITEVGIIQEKTATQKWLGRIGTFLMMGGFILVLFLIAGILIAISILSKGC
jgi:hypothetical protein